VLWGKVLKFLLNDDEVTPDENGNLPDLIFMCLRTKPKELHFKMEVDGKIRISTDDMDLCGDIVQALAEYLGVDDLASSCDFPPEIGKIEQLLVKADELQSVRQRLSSEMADQSGLIRTLIVRTEDSRIMMDM
jgi:Bardet-Biedl syndrome 2 protein